MKITARLSLDGTFWLVYVPEVGQYTQGRSVPDAKEMARDLAATVCDIPVGEVDLVATEFDLPPEVVVDLDRAAELRATADRANSESAMTIRRAARRLKESGYPVRAIGEALGISFQRAGQLTKT
ncbi:hypothetical protein nbrc107696_23110 [Gordonia spumicola]|uniref:Antitoxin HicB n=1 Tax=Gordonia spumicola TaxID=589161 RepID=A0A7I9V979_9ACTN|nr:type II toxin-antitoxin system HicB family antitoxin [Gordonia spumicola]GEE01865.1 hypothetical protein nbrc107696_23110 [Gordonia spumicola]